MELQQFFHMSGGEGDHSYANNSSQQVYSLFSLTNFQSNTSSNQSLISSLYLIILFSCLQKEAILNAKLILQESLFDFYCNSSFADCIRFADMGCSSGPNALLPTSEVIDALDKICHRLNRKPPILQVFLNDLPGNDFNTLFKSLPSFYDRLKKENNLSCLVAAVPGSFYGRLFPSCFLHFVYSSYSVHWLSQVTIVPNLRMYK